MDIGQHVELLHPIKGTPAGTRGIIKTVEPLTMQLYPLQNNVVLEVAESDLKVIMETETNGTAKLEKKKAKPRRKTVKN